MTCDSSRGMAMCHALNVFPRNLISSEGILGWGWLRLIPSSRACSAALMHTRSRVQVKEQSVWAPNCCHASCCLAPGLQCSHESRCCTEPDWGCLRGPHKRAAGSVDVAIRSGRGLRKETATAVHSLTSADLPRQGPTNHLAAAVLMDIYAFGRLPGAVNTFSFQAHRHPPVPH